MERAHRVIRCETVRQQLMSRVKATSERNSEWGPPIPTGETPAVSFHGESGRIAGGRGQLLLSTQRDPNEAQRWSLQELTPAPGYAAALAVEGHGWCLACWDWRIGGPQLRITL